MNSVIISPGKRSVEYLAGRNNGKERFIFNPVEFKKMNEFFHDGLNDKLNDKLNDRLIHDTAKKYHISFLSQ